MSGKELKIEMGNFELNHLGTFFHLCLLPPLLLLLGIIFRPTTLICLESEGVNAMAAVCGQVKVGMESLKNMNRWSKDWHWEIFAGNFAQILPLLFPQVNENNPNHLNILEDHHTFPH